MMAIAYIILQAWNFYNNQKKTQKKIQKMQKILHEKREVEAHNQALLEKAKIEREKKRKERVSR